MIHHTDQGTQPAPDPRHFLEHFPATRRSTIANWFHQACRDGATTPEAVLQAVRQVCNRRLEWGSNQDATMVLEAFDTDHTGAGAYAQHVIEYEQLPYAQRQQVKAERSLHFIKQVMVGKDATPAQLAFLAALGYQGPTPGDRAEASALIDRLRQGREQV